MWIYEKRLQYPVNITKTDARIAKIIASQYGGPDCNTLQIAGNPYKWCATRQVDKLNNENFFFPGTVYVPGYLCNVF